MANRTPSPLWACDGVQLQINIENMSTGVLPDQLLFLESLIVQNIDSSELTISNKLQSWITKIKGAKMCGGGLSILSKDLSQFLLTFLGIWG